MSGLSWQTAVLCQRVVQPPLVPSLVIEVMLSKISLLYYYSEMVAFWTYIHPPPQIRMYRIVYNKNQHLCTALWNTGGLFVVKMTLLFTTSRTGEKAIFQVFDLLSLTGRILSLRPGGATQKQWRAPGWATIKAFESWGQLCQPTCNPGLSVFIMLFSQQKRA